MKAFTIYDLFSAQSQARIELMVAGGELNIDRPAKLKILKTAHMIGAFDYRWQRSQSGAFTKSSG